MAEKERPDVDEVFVHIQEGVGRKKHLALQDPKARAKYLEHLAWRSGILFGISIGSVVGLAIGIVAGIQVT